MHLAPQAIPFVEVALAALWVVALTFLVRYAQRNAEAHAKPVFPARVRRSADTRDATTEGD